MRQGKMGDEKSIDGNGAKVFIKPGKKGKGQKVCTLRKLLPIVYGGQKKKKKHGNPKLDIFLDLLYACQPDSKREKEKGQRRINK